MVDSSTVSGEREREASLTREAGQAEIGTTTKSGGNAQVTGKNDGKSLVKGSDVGGSSGVGASGAESVETKRKDVNEIVQPRWSHLEYRWRLENFWELRALACVEALEDENGGLIWSQRFGDKERGVWQLKLYPYGDLSPAGRGHVSLFLSLDLKSLELPKSYAIFGCYLLDEDGVKVANSGRSFTRQKFGEGSSSWGWSQFIKVEGQSLNKLLLPPNDSLIIKCEIETFSGMLTAPGPELPMPMTYTTELLMFFSNPHNHNCYFRCRDRVVRANSFLLRARSRYIDRVVKNIALKWKEVQSNSVQTDTSSDSSRKFLGLDRSGQQAFDFDAQTSAALTAPPSQHAGGAQLAHDGLVPVSLSHSTGTSDSTTMSSHAALTYASFGAPLLPSDLDAHASSTLTVPLTELSGAAADSRAVDVSADAASAGDSAATALVHNSDTADASSLFPASPTNTRTFLVMSPHALETASCGKNAQSDAQNIAIPIHDCSPELLENLVAFMHTDE